jgi:transcriptional regulator with XRE-family HTH domain
MVIADKLKELRESKNLSQGNTEQRTDLLRCYISRVENGHTVASVDTLEEMARAGSSHVGRGWRIEPRERRISVRPIVLLVRPVHLDLKPLESSSRHETYIA